MTAPIYRTVCALTGEKSGLPALLAAADEITAEHDELTRLRRDNEMLRRQLDGMFENSIRVDELTAQCVAQDDEIRSLNQQLDSIRAGQPKRAGW